MNTAIIRCAMRETAALMLLAKLHPVLTYLHTDGSDAAQTRTLR